jgi:phosphonate dehydrogenase
MQPCLVITHRIDIEVIELLSHSFRVIPNITRETLPREELLRRAQEADALMIFTPDVIDRSFIKACPRLKIIAGAFKDSDNVDVDACTENGIWFTIVQDLLTAPDAGSTGDEVRRAMALEAVACIFEALSGEKPKGALNDPLYN